MTTFSLAKWRYAGEPYDYALGYIAGSLDRRGLVTLRNLVPGANRSGAWMDGFDDGVDRNFDGFTHRFNLRKEQS